MSVTKPVGVESSHQQVVKQVFGKAWESSTVHRVNKGFELITRGCEDLVTGRNGIVVDRKPRELREGADHALICTLRAFLGVA